MKAADSLLDGADRLGIELGEKQVDSLLAYGELILKCNKVYNLTALRDPASVLSHHLLDSLAVVRPLSLQSPNASTLLDVGSGAGLPGVVIAVMCPALKVTCVDAVGKKMAFVQQVAAELNLSNLRGVHQRIEDASGQYDVVTSRAFASLGDFFLLSQHLLAPDGVWLAMKGKSPADELKALPRAVDVFHVEQLDVPLLDAERCIVWAKQLEPDQV